MTVGEKESDELEKLLADVRHTIRENVEFIRHLKEEAVESDGTAEEPEDDLTPDDGYEEL